MSHITAAKRQSLPLSEFAGPHRSYSVDTVKRARNALSRISQHGSSELKAKVRSKVKRDWPGIKVSR